MSILSALRQQNSSIDDLAKLPQAMIMQMAQKKQISEDMLAPILARKAELADAFARDKAMQSAGQMPPTVMDQLMAKNAEAENPAPEQPMPQQMPPQMMAQQMPQSPDQAGVAQLPIPERAYAGGGIIAFDDGGEVDDIDPYEERRRQSRMESFGTPVEDLYAMLKRGAGRVRDMIPESYEAIKAKVSQAVMPETKRGDHPLEAKAVAAAQQVGLDPRLMLHALYKESGGLKDPATAQSKAGAYGPMQLMAGTAKDLGVDRKDVDQNIYGGAMYLKQMMDKYKDPQLALAAYNAGPGRVDKALRSQAGIAALPRETQGYMKYAQGGQVRHFYEGDYVDPMMGIPLVTEPEMGTFSSTIPGSPENLLANKRITQQEYDNIKKKQEALKPKKPTEVAPTRETPKEDVQDIINKMSQEQKVDPQRDIFADINARNVAMRDEIKKSAAEDRNLALLAAGLGMMGGTSPYAFANIGQGALKGVEFLGSSKAKRAAEQNALNKSEIEALYYGAENTRKNLAQGQLDASRLRDDANARAKMIYDNVAARYKNSPLLMTEEGQARIKAEADKALSEDRVYQFLQRQAYGNLGTPTAPSAPVLNYNPKTRSLG
jgi:hypothetical protein